jgi:hypothetical protein
MIARSVVESQWAECEENPGHVLLAAIPYQDPEMEAARLESVHEARVEIVPRVRAHNLQISREENFGRWTRDMSFLKDLYPASVKAKYMSNAG